MENTDKVGVQIQNDRHMCGPTEIKTTYLKGLAQQEDLSSHFLAWQLRTTYKLLTRGVYAKMR
jgi:hypothetical protein